MARAGKAVGEKDHYPAPGEAFRLSFSPGGIDVSGRLTDMASADELIRTINALKMLLRPASEIKKPDAGGKPEFDLIG